MVEPIHIKSASDEEMNSPTADEDAYEDTGELEIPRQLPHAWMVKVPKMVWDDWAALKHDEPLQIGVMRRYKTGPRAGKRFIMLNRQLPVNHKIPAEFEMKEEQKTVGNTFLFSERDMPNHRSKRIKRDPGAPSEAYSSEKPVRKSIPKQTRLAAAAKKEAQWVPVEGDDYRRIMAQRVQAEQASKRSMEVLEGDARLFGGNMLQPKGRLFSGHGTAIAARKAGFGDFVRSTAPQKGQLNKAARMPKNELLDIMFERFSEYRYWSIKSLRGHIGQPEEYLRQVAGEIGEYISHGPYAGTYQLKADYAGRTNGAGLNEKAPKIETDDAGTMSGMDGQTDDDESMAMEDIFPNPT